MMINKISIKCNICTIIVLTCLLLLSCKTIVDPTEQDLSRAEYFQKGIDAMDDNNYKLALKYYEATLQKFPNDLSGNLWASYEIAFIHYKMGNYKKAAELFDLLLMRYKQVGSESYIQAPRILAEKVIIKIHAKINKPTEKKTTEKESITEEPAVEEITSEEPGADESVIEEPTMETIKEEPIIEEPVTEEPTVEE